MTYYFKKGLAGKRATDGGHLLGVRPKSLNLLVYQTAYCLLFRVRKQLWAFIL